MVSVDTIIKGAKYGLRHGGKILVKFAPELLTGVGTAGVIAAIIFTAKKTPDAKKELDEAQEEWEEIDDKEKRVKADYIFKRVRIGVKHYWVVIVIAAGAITCFWLSNRISFKRFMSALTAAGIANKTKEELENKIKELDGEKHLTKLREEIDADRVMNNPPIQDQIINTGLGMHLCLEPISGRYFYSNIERIKRAVINCRDMLQKYGYLSLNDWYNELNLDTTEQQLCWSVSSIEEVNSFDISTSSQLTPDGIPVLVIRYDINPTMEYRDW